MTTLTPAEMSSLHRAGIGMYRPMGASIEKCDRLVSLGLLEKNASGTYFLTEKGAAVVAEQWK